MRDAGKRIALLLAVFGLAGLVAALALRSSGSPWLTELLRGQRLAPTRAEDYTPALDPALQAEEVPLLARLNEEYARLTEAVVPSVVAINTATEALEEGEPEAPFRRFYPDRRSTRLGLGSGVIISREGHVVTSYHVVASGDTSGDKIVDRIAVTLQNNQSYKARVVGYNRGVDIAVLRLESDRQDFPALQFGDSEQVRVGQLVFAIGNPFGLTETVTPGIISAKERRLSDASPALLQTNAMINPGSSGGPLVDVQGRIIGINRLIFTGSQDVQLWQGVGLAIPSNDVRDVVEAVLERGVPVWGFLGISCDNLDPVSAIRLGLKSAEGALITEVLRDSPASEAGLQVDDVVVRYDDQPIREKNELVHSILRSEAGRRVDLRVRRDGKEQTITATVGEYEQFRDRSETPEDWSPPESPEEQEILEWAGFTVRDLSEPERSRIRPPAVLVTRVRPDSPAAAAQLDPGCLIHRIGHLAAGSAGSFYQALRSSAGQTVQLTVTTRTGQGRVVELRLP